MSVGAEVECRAVSDPEAPRAQGYPRLLGIGSAGIALRAVIALAVIAAVVGGVFAYTTITRKQSNPDLQTAWSGRTATAVAAGPHGIVYAAFLREIYEFDLSTGTVKLIAGRATDPTGGQPAPAADGNAALGAAIRPSALAVGPQGQIYFADQLSETVRTIQGGALRSIGRAQQVGGVAVDEATGTVYFSDQEGDQVLAVNPATGGTAPLAGNGQPGFAGDAGPALAAELDRPEGLAVESGRLLIADSGNDRIRAVDLQTHVISTVAGTGKRGVSGDGGPAMSAELNDPSAVAVDPAGGFVIADQGNQRLRRVSGRGVITTLAGTGQAGTDNPESAVRAGNAHLKQPSGLVYAGQDLYFVDDFQLRKLSGGEVTFFVPPGDPR